MNEANQGNTTAYTLINCCRACESKQLAAVYDLGTLALTGIFPWVNQEQPPGGPLALVECSNCHLVQLTANYSQELMYGSEYGYRSSLNSSMATHLANLSSWLRSQYLSLGERRRLTILDIGSNDGTFLSNFDPSRFTRVGIDPTARTFLDSYASGDIVVAQLFSAEAYWEACNEPADVVTTISMFYDLPDPVSFASDVRNCLSPDGIWYLEQSYLPAMLRQNSFDTICHEHLEYYSLTSLTYILERAQFRILDVVFNSTNGGSVGVVAVPETSTRQPRTSVLDWWMLRERRHLLSQSGSFAAFAARTREIQRDLGDLVQLFANEGAVVGGLGASTKGNVLLQTCNIDARCVSFIGDVNPFKYGRCTPGSRIPIIPEEDMRARKPDVLLVLPWHFKEGIIARERDFLARGGRLLFPLPDIEVVSG